MRTFIIASVLLILLTAGISPVRAQIALSGAAVTETFDGMNGGTALPANWKMSAAGVTANWTTGTNVTAANAAACGTAPTAGARYNWGVSAACTDRAIGFMTSGTYASPNTILSHYQNTSGSNIADITITFDVERYRINTTAFSLTFFTSTDGTTWTSQTAGDVAAGVFATGASAYTFATPQTVSKTVTLTGFNLPASGNLYLRWVFNTGGSSSQGIGIDNVSLTTTAGAGCVSDTEPATASSALTFTNVGCNSMTLSWTNGNGAKRLVVMRAGSAVTATPTDQQVYAASSVFGSGAALSAGQFAVYNGTGNSVTVTGLAGSTTYHYAIYEYNGTGCPASGENYLLTAVLTGSQATLSTCQCPYITGVMINACSGTCSEGDNEIIFLNSGAYSIPVAPANFIIKYENANPATITYTDALVANTTFVNSMNTAAGCGTLFYDAMTVGTIPANSVIMVMRSTACYGYDFSSFCGGGPIYVVFSTDVSWNTSGNFSNSCTTTRYFRTDFTAIGACVMDYNFDPCLMTGTDGDAISFGPAGGAATSYFNDGCNPPPTILPIELVSFTAEAGDDKVHFEWTTASETSNSFFTVERTTDGQVFTGIEVVPGSGSTSAYSTYSAVDESPVNGTSYYRLKQTDLDGSSSWSSLVAVNMQEEGIVAWIDPNSSNNLIEVYISDDAMPVTIEVMDVTGRTVLMRTAQPGTTLVQVDTHPLPNGVYLVRAGNGIRSVSKKISRQ